MMNEACSQSDCWPFVKVTASPVVKVTVDPVAKPWILKLLQLPTTKMTASPVVKVTVDPVAKVSAGLVVKLTAGPVVKVTAGPLVKVTASLVDKVTTGPAQLSYSAHVVPFSERLSSARNQRRSSVIAVAGGLIPPTAPAPGRP
ncbi:hypothetical protein ACJJTC_005248 [Scirpophaga incertulas]